MNADVLLITQNLINALKENLLAILSTGMGKIAVVGACILGLVHLWILFCKLTGIDFSKGRW